MILLLYNLVHFSGIEKPECMYNLTCEDIYYNGDITLGTRLTQLGIPVLDWMQYALECPIYIRECGCPPGYRPNMFKNMCVKDPTDCQAPCRCGENNEQMEVWYQMYHLAVFVFSYCDIYCCLILAVVFGSSVM